MRHATYPQNKKSTEVHFKLNSDDYSSADIRKITKYLKDNGMTYKYYRMYSDTKLMSWGVFRLPVYRYCSFEENETVTKSILSAVFDEPMGLSGALINPKEMRDVSSLAFKCEMVDTSHGVVFVKIDNHIQE